MGDSAQGTILTGQAQGVRPGGTGITIGTDGIISVNSQTIVGVMKLGQTPASAAAAYNGYTWPTTAGASGQQLETNGAGGLSWADADGIDWTSKGQLIVGTGVGTDILLNAGGNTSFLMADSGSGSGLTSSDSVTSAAQMPKGGTAQRGAGAAGQIRFNTDTSKFEFFNGAVWQEIASGNSPTPPIPPTIVSSVDVSGGTTGFSFTGGPVTSSGTMTMSGFLNVANGGTGATTAAGARNNLLPAQGGNAGEYLTTDGTNASWAPVVTSVNASGGTTGLNFSGGPITTTGVLTMGGTLALANGGTGATTQPTAINNLLPGQVGNNTKVLTTDGTNVSWQPGASGPTSVRAWLSFDGFTATILDGYGFSSVTYLSTGYFQLNFSTPFPNTEYAVTIGVTDNDAGPGSYVNFGWINAFSRTTGGFVLRTAAAGFGPRDSPNVSVMLADNP